MLSSDIFDGCISASIIQCWFMLFSLVVMTFKDQTGKIISGNSVMPEESTDSPGTHIFLFFSRGVMKAKCEHLKRKVRSQLSRTVCEQFLHI